MRSWLEAFLIAMSMYSVCPVKCMNWTNKNLKHALVFFPVVGLLCGAMLTLVWIVCRSFDVSSLLFGILGVCSIVFITGGIHLDGFCDTADALFSRRSQDEKLRILKDPTCGPFAVFSVILALMVTSGSLSEIYSDLDIRSIGLLSAGFVISRCMNAFAQVSIKAAATSSLAKTFGSNASKSVRYILVSEAAVVFVASVLLYGYIAAVLMACMILVYILFYHMQKKEFGGLTGDLVGFMLVISETVWILIVAVFGGVML